MKESLNFEKEIERSNNLSKIWSSLEKDEEFGTQILPDDKNFYIEKLEYLMSHNQEKYRDINGKNFYIRITNFIHKLKQV